MKLNHCTLQLVFQPTVPSLFEKRLLVRKVLTALADHLSQRWQRLDELINKGIISMTFKPTVAEIRRVDEQRSHFNEKQRLLWGMAYPSSKFNVIFWVSWLSWCYKPPLNWNVHICFRPVDDDWESDAFFVGFWRRWYSCFFMNSFIHNLTWLLFSAFWLTTELSHWTNLMRGRPVCAEWVSAIF